MRVWVTLVGYDYEGEGIVGVFSTHDLAEEARLRVHHGDFTDVVEYELDEVDQSIIL